MNTCVACGQEYAGDNHHCDPAREARIEAARHAHDELGIERRPTEAARLFTGFNMLEMGEGN